MMSSNWNGKPTLLICSDEFWIKQNTQGVPSSARPIHSSSTWPSATPPVAPSSSLPGPSDERSRSHTDIQASFHDHPTSPMPPAPQERASNYYDKLHTNDPPYRPLNPKSFSLSTWYTRDGPTLPAPNRAPRIPSPSKHEQEEAEETARDSLGPCVIDLPTVQLILGMQATRMNPMDWVAVGQVIRRQPEAGRNLSLLANLLKEEAKAERAKQM